MSKKKYLVVGGMVTSQQDGQLHYVDAQQLVRLYGVDLAECVTCNEHDEWRVTQGMSDFDLMVLRPRRDGDYRGHLERLAGQMVSEKVDGEMLDGHHDRQADHT